MSYTSVSLDAKDFPGLKKAKMGEKVRVIATLRKMHDGQREESYGPKTPKVDVEIQAIQEGSEDDFSKKIFSKV